MKTTSNQEPEKTPKGQDKLPFTSPTPGFLVPRYYQRAWLLPDLVAGLVIFTVSIPTALAYGQMAGLQPVNGLYASLLAMGLYWFFGTSRQLIIDAEAAIAILVASSLTSVASGGDPGRYATLAMMEAIIVGVIQVAGGVARIGFIADFIPKAVMVGFINGVALIIIMAQAGKIFGIKLSQEAFFPRVWEVIVNIHKTHLPTLVIAVACLSALFLFRRLLAKFPEAVLVAVLSTVAVIWWDLGTMGVKLIGTVPSGLPVPAFPKIKFDDLLNLLPTAAGVAFISYADTIITGQAFAMRGGYHINPNNEMIALGMTNLGTGFFNGFAVGSSHSRTAVNDMYGGKTQFAGLFAAVFLALFLLWLTKILKNVPVVALSAIVIMAGVHLLNVREILSMLRKRARSGYLSISTTFAVLAGGVMIGLFAAVALSIIFVLHRLARPHETVYRLQVPGLLVYRFAAPLLYFNASYFAERVRQLIVTADPPVTFFLINAESMPDMDLTAAHILEELYNELKNQGIVLGICDAKGHFRQVLKDTGMTARIGGLLYHSVSHVVQALTAVPVPAKPGPTAS